MNVSLLVFLGMVLSILVSGAGACQPADNYLFSRVDLKTTKLSGRQAKILDRVSRQKAHTSVEVVKLEKARMGDSAEPLIIPLPRNQAIKLTQYKFAAEDDVKQLTGNTSDSANSASLVLTGDSVSGMVYSGKNVYSIEPLGGGLQAVICLDQTRFPPDEPPAEQKKLESPRR